jgi:membrane protease YdiL (CAAX protease family)
MPFTLLLVLIILFLSWFFIYLPEKRNILSTWITPAKLRFKEFAIGFTLMGTLCLLSQLFFTLINDTGWSVSSDINITRFLSATLADVNGVLIEELVARGVLLYALIKFTSERTGVLVSSAAFGIYHWSSYGVLGNLLGMALVFITTGLMGYVFAKAYVKTQSIILPVGLHLGWNWVNGSIFSNGLSGTVLLVPDQTVAMEGIFAMISFLWYLVVPIVVLFFINSDVFDRLTVR